MEKVDTKQQLPEKRDSFRLDEITVRRYREPDAEAVANLLARNFREVNSKDYGKEAMEKLVRTHDADWVRQLTGYAHMYVFCREEEIVGCGSISSFWGSETESIILTVFVLPEYQGNGLGRKIIQTLEQDELFLRADRIEIPASITGAEFYRKFGYDYKNGVKELDGEGHYRLEKFRNTGRQQGIKVRQMVITDYEEIYHLWVHTPGMGLNNLDDSREGIEKYLKRNPSTCFVAEERGKMIGVILSGHDGRRGFIYHTTVHPDYRRRGIGRLLVTRALKALEQEGINKAALVVFGRNETGNAFWEKLGFMAREDLVYRNQCIREMVRMDI